MTRNVKAILAVGVVVSAAGLGFGVWTRTSAPPQSVEPTSGGVLTVDNRVINLGRLAPGTEVPLKYVIRNTGDRTVRVLEVRQSCGCAPASLPSSEFVPGQSQEVTIKYRVPEMLGDVTQAVWLRTDADNDPEVQLTFKARVEWSLESSPNHLEFGHQAPGSSVTRQIKLLATDGRKFAVTGISAPPFVQVKKATGEAIDSCHRYDLSVAVPSGTSEFFDFIHFLTDHPDRGKIVVRLTGTVGSHVGCIPPLIQVSGKPGSSISASVSIPNPTGAKVIAVSVADKTWSVTGQKSTFVGDRVKLTVDLRSPAVAGYLRTTLRVEFGDGKSTVEIPVGCYLTE